MPQGQPDLNSTKIFISYSRHDTAKVARIVSALEAHGGIHVFQDTADSLPTEEWKKRLEDLISASDTVVFCLSPASARSEVCAWEVDVAERRGKRIAPLLLEKLDGDVPQGLAKLNYVLATDLSRLDTSVAELVEALDTDIAWIREHTRIGELARRWALTGNPKDELLRGGAVDAAEQWVKYRPSKAPALTDDMAAFIGASRHEAIAVERRRRRTLAVLASLVVAIIAVSGLAYAGYLDATYLEGQYNGLRNRWRDSEIRVGDVIRDCASAACPELVVLPGGEFIMGSPEGEPERVKDEGPQHRVKIAGPLLVGKFEVTFGEWDACHRAGGCSFLASDQGWGRGRRPVINVSWNDLQQYLTWLSLKTGMPYRLLTEAEWEYAARAVTDASAPHHVFTWGDTFQQDLAHCQSCTAEPRKQTIEVGAFPPNGFGLHDMSGNVWEWVKDCYIDDYSKTPTDGIAAPESRNCRRVLRGGAYNTGSKFIRPAYRNRQLPGQGYSNVGFRVARVLVPVKRPF